MLSGQAGALLRQARRHSDLSQEELARRGGVSTRLVAEFERGTRPNVGFDTVLRLFGLVGVTVSLTGPGGASLELRAASAEAVARAERAAHRRATWSGRHAPLAEAGIEPEADSFPVHRLATTMRISRQVHEVSRAGRAAGPDLTRRDAADGIRTASRRAGAAKSGKRR